MPTRIFSFYADAAVYRDGDVPVNFRSLSHQSIAESENDTIRPGGYVTINGDDEMIYQGTFNYKASDYFVFRKTDGQWNFIFGDTAFSDDGPTNQDLESLIDKDVSFPICFLPGTLIATPSGPRAVETLAAGDQVCTADGRTVSVLWMGRQTLHKLFSPAERFCPIRVHAGAFEPGVPERDLRVTADHALMIDGLAVNAAALVNGRSILREDKADLPERLTYWHIETEAHDVVLAEGAPAETFVDNVTRRRFDNYADYEARFGEEVRRIEESPAPRVMSRRQLPETIRARLVARADELEQAETAAA